MTVPVRERIEPQRVFQTLGWTVAAILLLFSSFALYRGIRLRKQVATLESDLRQLSARHNRVNRALAIVMSPDARLIRLRRADEKAEPAFRAWWSRPAGFVLTGANVPKPPAQRTWQLWLVPKSGAPVSGGAFLPTDRGEVWLISGLAGRPEDPAALAISEEPEGGSAQPTTTLVWVGPLSE